MLVLSRKKNESIILTLPSGDTIRVSVVDLYHGKVRLGFEASKEVKIFREELLKGEDDGENNHR